MEYAKYPFNRKSTIFAKAEEVTPETLLDLIVVANRHFSIKPDAKKPDQDLEDLVRSVAEARWLPMKDRFWVANYMYHCADEDTRASESFKDANEIDKVLEQSKTLMEKTTTFETEQKQKTVENFVVETEESASKTTKLVPNADYS